MFSVRKCFHVLISSSHSLLNGLAALFFTLVAFFVSEIECDLEVCSNASVSQDHDIIIITVVMLMVRKKKKTVKKFIFFFFQSTLVSCRPLTWIEGVRFSLVNFRHFAEIFYQEYYFVGVVNELVNFLFSNCSKKM